MKLLYLIYILFDVFQTVNILKSNDTKIIKKQEFNGPYIGTSHNGEGLKNLGKN
jgi:hypothetical protein